MAVGALLATMASFLLGTTPASAKSVPAPSPTFTFTDTVRALSPDEIRAKGLDRLAPGARLVVIEPRIISATKPKVADPPVKRTASAAVSSGASTFACWSHSWTAGTDAFGGLWGQTNVTWCGSDTITYTSGYCFGYDGGYPTYEYLGCQYSPSYGVGWYIWEVWSQFHLCGAWVPKWGVCLSDSTPWRDYAYAPEGAIYLYGQG